MNALEYNIIDNICPDTNHSTHITELFKKNDHITVATPFIMPKFESFFEEITSNETIKNLHLITTLDNDIFALKRKMEGLYSLINTRAIKNNEIICKISISKGLHGKVYIFKKNNQISSAIISSANLTRNGLEKNYEWGVEIFSEEKISSTESNLLGIIKIEELHYKEISAILNKTKEVIDKFNLKEHGDVGFLNEIFDTYAPTTKEKNLDGGKLTPDNSKRYSTSGKEVSYCIIRKGMFVYDIYEQNADDALVKILKACQEIRPDLYFLCEKDKRNKGTKRIFISNNKNGLYNGSKNEQIKPLSDGYFLATCTDNRRKRKITEMVIDIMGLQKDIDINFYFPNS